MESADEGIVSGKSSAFKDFGHYVGWSLLWGGLFGLFTPVYNVDANFASVKVAQTGFGLLFGFVFAVLFTLAQNAMNARRRKAVSWALAIGLWFGLKVAVALIFAS